MGTALKWTACNEPLAHGGQDGAIPNRIETRLMEVARDRPARHGAWRHLALDGDEHTILKKFMRKYQRKI